MKRRGGMRRVMILVGLVGALVVVAPAGTADQTIVISAAGFTPRNVTINVGDAVTWTNTDTRAHQVVVDRVCSITVQPASTGTCTFRVTGRFDYREPTQNRNAWRGTITVRAAATGVTIGASPRLVTYLGATTLSGAVSTAQANERVAVRAQPCGSTSFAALATVTTTTGGAWTLGARSQRTTVYEAQWRGATARTTVTVRPRVTVRKLTRGRFAVRVSAAQGFGGKIAVLQRRTSTGRWVRVRYVTLRVMGGTAPTVISGANVRVNIRVGTRVRAVIGAAQVAPCYAAGTSNVVRR
jgi:plastocyanin